MAVKTEAYNKLKSFVATQKYVSLKQVNSFLEKEGYHYSRETIQKYLGKLKKEKVLYQAGRGYYSTNKKSFPLRKSDFKKLITLITKKYPLLDFSLWSTKMLASLFHHTQNQFLTFVYSEVDSLPFLRDYLTEKGLQTYLNPSKKDIIKNPFSKDAIILRPRIERENPTNHIANIEKILVDLFMENKRLNIIEQTELENIFKNILNDYLINISNLLDYAQRRKNKENIQGIISKYTNVTF